MNVTVIVADSAALSYEALAKVDAALEEVESLISGDNYIRVNSGGTPIENGAALKAALNAAAGMTPNGSPLAADNRVTVLASPGIYEFADEADAPVLDTSFVDLVSLTGERDLFFDLTDGTAGGDPDYAVHITADNVRVSGVDCGAHKFHVDAELPNIKIINNAGGDRSFCSDHVGQIARGTYKKNKGGNRSFYSFCDGANVFSEDNEGLEFCFGSNDQLNASAYEVTGTHRRNYGLGFSFARGAVLNGLWEWNIGDGFFCFGSEKGIHPDAELNFNWGGAASFAHDGPNSIYGADGKFKGNYCPANGFGKRTSCAGTFDGDHGGNNGFGGDGGDYAGYANNVTAAGDAFGGAAGTNTGAIAFSRMTSGTFPEPTGAGKIIMSVDGDGNLVHTLAEKPSLVDNDFVWIVDSEDGNKFKKVKKSNLGLGLSASQEVFISNQPRLKAYDTFNQADGVRASLDSGQDWDGDAVNVVENEAYSSGVSTFNIGVSLTNFTIYSDFRSLNNNIFIIPSYVDADNYFKVGWEFHFARIIKVEGGVETSLEASALRGNVRNFYIRDVQVDFSTQGADGQLGLSVPGWGAVFHAFSAADRTLFDSGIGTIGIESGTAGQRFKNLKVYEI